MVAETISVVTPSYNQADFIGDNLRSVERQTHDDIQHLILDGGSEDGTVSLLEAYEQGASHDVFWRSEPDEGQSAAINDGFDRATGDIVGWLNSDDVYFDTGVFERVVSHFRNTEADVIYGDLAYVDGESRVTEIDVRPEFDRSKLAYRILLGQPATFFRREVLAEHRLDTSLEFCMDYEFWIRLSAEFEFEHVDDVLAGFRQHEKQKTEDMHATTNETEQMLSRYADTLPNSAGNVAIDNAETELKRLLKGVRRTLSVHRTPPEFAFNSELAPLSTMLRNLGPGVTDVQKALRRL
jgi:glycosyltransferase involved in cell wall biosynthesis